MDIEFRDPSRRRRVALVTVGAVLAAVGGLGAFTLASKGSPQAAVPTKSVLVAARDIPARTTVSGDDVTTRSVPVAEALSQSYAAPSDVVGRVTSVPIYGDQQITPNLFATSSANSDFSILGPNDTVTADSPLWRAVAISIPPERAVGGEVKSGQRVDLVVSVQIEVLNQDAQGNYVKCEDVTASQFQCGTSTKITFQDIAVLKATPDDDMYVFKVDLRQAEQIAHVLAEAPDSFTMVLRPDEDTRPVDTSQYGTTTDRLIMTYLYPAPRLLDVTQLIGPSPYPYPGSSAAPAVPGTSPVPGTGGEPGASPSGSPEPSPEASSAP